MNDRFIFAYGHAPRPAEHIKTLLEAQGQIVATGLAASSKKQPIPLGQLFVEPPYALSQETLMRRSSANWTTFFLAQRRATHVVPIGGPPEFNYVDEFLAYQSYASLFADRSHFDHHDLLPSDHKIFAHSHQ